MNDDNIVIIIISQGGMIQEVFSTKDADVHIIDYDTVDDDGMSDTLNIKIKGSEEIVNRKLRELIKTIHYEEG